jgi:HEAT repeat protein
MIYGPAAKALLPFLSDADVKTRQAAATAIRSIGNADVAEDLVAHLKDADPVVRRESARALEIAMPDTLASDVAEQAKDAAQDPATRVSLIGALQFHAPAKLARETLVKLLQGDAPPNVRRRAAYALTRVVEKGDVRAIAKLFDKEPEPFAAQRLAYTLNLLTGKHLSLNDKQSAPGHRAQLVKEWLSN